MGMRIAINGFGRIGRNVFRLCATRDDVEVVHINDLTDAKTLAYLLKYDSIHGRFEGEVKAIENAIVVNGRTIPITAIKDPAQLPHKQNKVDFAIEATGVFASREGCQKHIDAGAAKVILTVPSKDPIDATIVMGVNESDLKPEHRIISNASCTTNCVAPVAKILDEAFGIERGLMTTIHAYTNDQNILDLPHKDLRRARAAAMSIIPTTTGAAKATSLVIPEVKGKIDGVALRVPTADVSLVDLTCTVKKSTSIEEVNAAFQEAAKGSLKGILAVSDEPLVSADYIGNLSSSTVDLALTNVLEGTLVHVSSWYDNEMGYSARCVDLIRYIGQRL
jgi:glyceraldehyde 3-phosphate dehydrogenase